MNFSTVTFHKKLLQDLVWCESSELEVISDEIIDHTRWSLIHDLIFRDKSTGQFFQVGYSVGATEYQDEQPFANDDDLIECYEVVPVEKTITTYERKAA